MRKSVLSTVNRLSPAAWLLCLAVFAFQGLKADEHVYPDSWGAAGFSLENQSSQSVVLNYSVDRFIIGSHEIDGQPMHFIQLPGHFLPSREGAPNLPGNGRFIAIPQGAVASYKVLSYRTETFTGIELEPAPRIPWETETGPLVYRKDEEIYSRNRFYPEQPVMLSEPDVIRGVDVVMLGITPFHYNPVTLELVLYRDIRIEISFEGGNGHFGEDRLRSRWFDPILSDALLNWSSLPEMDYSRMYQPSDTPDWEYIIITPNDPVYISWADSIKVFRTLQGIRSGVVTTTEAGGNTTSAIESYLNNAYNTWAIPPVAVLLLGDYGTSGNTVVSPIWDNYCASDNIYADVTGNSMPDIVLARMTAQNATHVQTMVTKFLNYERNPPTNPGFYDNPITALGWQTERWFQICAETCGGFWKHEMGKTPARINAIYSGSPGSTWSTATNTSTVVNYFGPNGLGYIPATPAELGGWTGGNASLINNAINSGCFMLLHRDHGGTSGWGEPAYSSSDINGLHNTDLTYVWSVNCLTGKYNYSSEVFAEKFHRYTYNGANSGALGIVAASEVSYSFVNDTYVWGAWDNMWPDFMPGYGTTPDSRGVLPAFANAAGKYFLQQSSWPYNTSNKEVTYNLFHHHGDAFSTVYCVMPQNLTVVHNPILYAGVTSFDIQANDGSFIALTVNGEIIGTAEGTGAPVTILIPGQTPPDQVLVTVTLQNYFRYTALVDVIPPTGPYVVRKSYTINDVTGGNGDGLMDYGETNLLTLEVENVGVQAANNVTVTLSTTDTCITITDGTEFYGTIPAGGSLSVTDGFAYDVANNLPDGHVASFEVSATDGTNTWVSYFFIPGHAPVLEFVDYTLADPNGNNNGKWDPGETVQITIEVENSGSSEAFNVAGVLSESDPYITVTISQGSYGNMSGGATAMATFTAQAAANTPAGHMASFDFDITADLGITGSGTFGIVVGQVPVLVLNLDPTPSSGMAMQTAIQTLDVGVEYTTTFPSDLNLYSSIFVCLGIYDNNHELTSSEGQLLAAYLNQGGSLYMEGGDTWYYDDQTAVHAMFNINATSDGSSDMSTVLGQAGTFTEGMSFPYNGENNWMDHIEPVSPAFKILQNQSPSYGTGVAYDAGTYKTIGTSHEFGGLQDGASPSTKEELMREYLIFLGVIPEGVTAGFTSNATQICTGDNVEFYDGSYGNIISWNWTFEGGTPGTSTQQNPVVTYNTTGSFDVTLIVSDGLQSDTLSMTDYIGVSAVPGVPGTPTGPTSLCLDPLNTTYNTSGATNATTYVWEITPANAGTITGTGTNATVNWDDAFTGAATIKVCGVNYCGNGLYSNALTVTVHPLPTVTLDPFPMVCVWEPPFMLTGGLPEGGEYSGTGVSNGWFDPAAAGVGTHTITYSYTDPNGCSNQAEQTIVVDPCTGILEYETDGLVHVYPNPNEGSFTVKMNLETQETLTIRLLNAMSEVVFEERHISVTASMNYELNLPGLNAGVYYLHVVGDKTLVTRKIIIR